MKVTRSNEYDGNLATNLCSYLTQLKDNSNILFNQDHLLKHPLAIYNVSANRFYKAYNEMIDIVDCQNKSDPIFSNFYLPTKEVFDSFSSHIDDIYHIFKCFFPASYVSKETDFANTWLDRATKTNDQCREAVKEFDNNISFCSINRKINNKLKHKHGRIHEITVKTVFGKSVGFFIEAVDLTGAILPDEEFHKKHYNDSTAYSYNWLLLEMLTQFYFVDNYAARALKKIIYGLHSNNIPLEKVIIEKNEILDTYKKLDRTLSNTLFPDEYTAGIPQVLFDGDTLILKKPADRSYLKRFVTGSKYQVELILHPDGVSKQYVLPYWHS